MGLIAVFCLIATINSLAVGMLDRRAEFAGMGLLGVAKGQIRRMVTWETALSILPILILATVLAAWTAFLFAVRAPGGLAASPGFVPWDWLGALGGGALLAGVIGALLVARAVLKEAA